MVHLIENSTHTDIAVQKHLSAPMPWIGLYVATSSFLCTIAMITDIFRGVQRKKYWFPSKYFSLNSTSLTLLAVAMKLPVDLTTQMYTATDRLAKVSSLALLSTSMVNFLPSLGSMDNKDIVVNVTALGILVITVMVNVIIQIVQLQKFLKKRLAFPEEMLELGLANLLLVMTISTALMLPSIKHYLETNYNEMHKSALKEEQVGTGRLTCEKLRLLVKKYWVMAETSNPQFVIARSVTCTSSGVISLLVLLILVESPLRMVIMACTKLMRGSNSAYAWSTKWIFIMHTIGVIVGTISPVLRCFTAITFMSANKSSKSIKSAFIVEGYWIQKMVAWKQSSVSSKIHDHTRRKILHQIRGKILTLFIAIQSVIVVGSKLVLLVTLYMATPIFWWYGCIKRLKTPNRVFDSSISEREEVSEKSELEIEHYVMLLEGEGQLPKETLNSICKAVDKVIQQGKMKKPENLLKLLQTSCNFNGVMEFDSHQVPNLHSQELPYSWSLPVVTLTSIAIGLPNINKSKSSLVNSVTEGLSFVRRVEKNLDRKGSLENIRNAANVIWVGVELHHRWQDRDLHELSLKGISSKQSLQELADEAEKTVLEYQRDVKDRMMKNSLHWPAKIIAANSMYRISKTLLVRYSNESKLTDKRLFEQISLMIADILAACLTNLPRVITMKCHRTAIETREQSVHKAALLLGETEEILEFLEHHELPGLAPNQAAYIEEWRKLVKRKDKNHQGGSVSMTNIDVQKSKSREEHVAIRVEPSPRPRPNRKL